MLAKAQQASAWQTKGSSLKNKEPGRLHCSLLPFSHFVLLLNQSRNYFFFLQTTRESRAGRDPQHLGKQCSADFVINTRVCPKGTPGSLSPAGGNSSKNAVKALGSRGSHTHKLLPTPHSHPTPSAASCTNNPAGKPTPKQHKLCRSTGP